MKPTPKLDLQIPVEWEGLPLLFCPESYSHQPFEPPTEFYPGCDEELSLDPDSGYLLLDASSLPMRLTAEEAHSYYRLLNEHNTVYNEVLEANYETLCQAVLDKIHQANEPDSSDESLSW